MKLINSPGWETVVIGHGVITDKEAIDVDDELGAQLLAQHPTLKEIEE